MGGRTATDADSIVRAGAGVSTALMSIPARYLHTPVEQVDLRDVAAGLAVLERWVADGAAS
jgi:endoglucanase